jgi:nucleotide-binding universal stress UspA family protein
MYKHILIATDGSELAKKAETQGLALAKEPQGGGDGRYRDRGLVGS